MNCNPIRVFFFFFLFANFILGFQPSAYAYVEFAKNYDLIEEVQRSPYRILPRSPEYALAIDADFFKPVFLGGDNFNYYKWDFYHGNGYWITTRAEFRPVDRLSLNLKFLITQGTSSNGPVYQAVVVPLAALTYHERLLGFDWTTRLGDIGRQTVGSGLFIEDKDTVGGFVKGRRDQFEMGLMVDGTGSFRLEGGVLALESSMWNGILGATLMFQETSVVTRPPPWTATVFSRRWFPEGLGYGVEAGTNDYSWAGSAYLLVDRWWGDQVEAGLHYRFKPQVRYYGKRIMGNLGGRVAHNYISYEQNDRAFTNFMNILSVGDHVFTASAELNLEYVFNIFYRAYVETEFLNYDYQSHSDVRSIFFRTGFKFFPFKERADHFGFLVGNKYLIASSTQLDNMTVETERSYVAPNSVDFENKATFLKQLYFMVNYYAKF